MSASAVFSLVSLPPDADFEAWGWRMPFLISGVLVGVGVFVRARLPETPVFQNIKSRSGIVKSPFLEIVHSPRTKLGLTKYLMLNAISLGALLELATIPLFGRLSDRIGRRPLYFFGVAFTIVFAFPLFWLLVRYTGASLGFRPPRRLAAASRRSSRRRRRLSRRHSRRLDHADPVGADHSDRDRVRSRNQGRSVDDLTRHVGRSTAGREASYLDSSPPRSWPSAKVTARISARKLLRATGGPGQTNPATRPSSSACDAVRYQPP